MGFKFSGFEILTKNTKNKSNLELFLKKNISITVFTYSLGVTRVLWFLWSKLLTIFGGNKKDSKEPDILKPEDEKSNLSSLGF